MSRPRQTLADYMVIAISPALIMTMVGSLVFFLIEVFYRGPYAARLGYISALFIFAAVLIARIAMTEGRAYASIFALFLAGAVWMAMKRFTQIPFPLDVALIAVIWWCADKLTWDCTLVDDSKDPSNQGLLQTVGLARSEEEPSGAPAPAHESAPEGAARAPAPPAPSADRPSSRPDGEGIVTAAMNDPEAAVQDLRKNVKTWWGRFRRRPNRPGVWVVYFSLAALPLFGVGQWLIPVGDSAGRRYAFVLLCVYLASGFGLLMTTSFLGLRHYLRKRQLQMPGYMAGVWLGAGALKIALLLVFVSMLTLLIWIVPRQKVETAIAQIPLHFSSPDDLKPSRHGFGNDGPRDDEKATRTGKQSSQPQAAQKPPGEKRKGKAPATNQPDQRGGQGDQGAKQERQTGERPSEKGAGEDRSENKKTPGGSKPAGSKSPGGGKSGGAKSKERQGAASKEKTPAGSPKKSGGKAGAKRQPAQQRSAGGGPGRRRPSGSDQDRRASEPQQRDGSSQEDSQPSSSDRSSETLSKMASALGPLLKWLFYLVLVCLAALFGWFFRKELRAAWARFVEQLRQVWQLLFGRRKAAAEEEPEQQQEEPETPPRPFSDFPDPFTSGLARRWSPDELVRYSFEAFEAWAREQGCGRRPEQTPHELARQVGFRLPSLAPGARALADLYCQVAYAPGSLQPASVERLEDFWQQLRLAGALA